MTPCVLAWFVYVCLYVCVSVECPQTCGPVSRTYYRHHSPDFTLTRTLEERSAWLQKEEDDDAFQRAENNRLNRRIVFFRSSFRGPPETLVNSSTTFMAMSSSWERKKADPYRLSSNRAVRAVP